MKGNSEVPGFHPMSAWMLELLRPALVRLDEIWKSHGLHKKCLAFPFFPDPTQNCAMVMVCVWLPSSNCKRHNLRWAADGVKWTAQGISPWKFPSRQFRAWNVKYAHWKFQNRKGHCPGHVWNAARSNCWWSCEAPSCGAPDKAQVRRSTARNTAASFGWAEAKAPRTGSDSLELMELLVPTVPTGIQTNNLSKYPS